jgi:hypothetical protein
MSTEHHLTQTINVISQAMNENKFCIGVFFDLKKAFDVCSLDILLRKLDKMGVSGVALRWFSSYLQVILVARYHQKKKLKLVFSREVYWDQNFSSIKVINALNLT